MSHSFYESDIEQLALDILKGEQGYTVLFGPDISEGGQKEREYTEVILQNRINRKDIDLLAEYLGIPEKVRFDRFIGQKENFRERIRRSLLPKELAEAFDKLLIERFQRLNIA